MVASYQLERLLKKKKLKIPQHLWNTYFFSRIEAVVWNMLQ